MNEIDLLTVYKQLMITMDTRDKACYVYCSTLYSHTDIWLDSSTGLIHDYVAIGMQ